jgi:tellurite resistance-related uncharacterized protein
VTSFEEESIGAEAPDDPFYLYNDAGTHVVSNSEATDGSQSFYTAGAGTDGSQPGNASAIAVELDLSNYDSLKHDVFTARNYPKYGDIKISLDNAGYENSGNIIWRMDDELRERGFSPYKDDDRWYKECDTDLTEYDGQHEVIFWVDGSNDVYWDNIRFFGRDSKEDESVDSVVDSFSDGEYADRWSVPDRDDEAIQETAGVLRHISPEKTNARGDMVTKRAFRAEGTVTISVRQRQLATDYWGSGFGILLGESRITLREHKWEEHDRLAVFTSEEVYRVGNATDDNGWMTYNLTINFDTMTLVSVSRGGQRWELGIDLPETESETFRITLGDDRNHDTLYDFVRIVPLNSTVVDSFSDGEYADRWSVPDRDDEVIQEAAGVLRHTSPDNTNARGDVVTKRTFRAEGTVTISVRQRQLVTDYWGSGFGILLGESRITLREHKWQEHDRLAVFTSEDVYRVGNATDDNGWMMYNMTIDLDTMTLVSVSRGNQRWKLGIDLPETESETFRITLGDDRNHDTLYDFVHIV